MFRILKQNGLRAIMAACFAVTSTVAMASEGFSPFSTSTVKPDNGFKRFSFGVSTFGSVERPVDFTTYQNAMKLRMENFSNSTRPSGSSATVTKQKPSATKLKARIAAAKKQAEQDQKRLQSFDKRLATLSDTQKQFFQGQRDRIAKKAKSSQAALAKLQAQAAPKYAGKGGARYHSLIAKYASANRVPLKLAHAVVRVESAYRANARGGAGEIGLMQIKLATARGMGYRGSAKGLYDPATNLKWGMKYLGKAHQLSGGSTCGTILKYNAGHGAKSMNPVSRRYCNRVARYI